MRRLARALASPNNPHLCTSLKSRAFVHVPSSTPSQHAICRTFFIRRLVHKSSSSSLHDFYYSVVAASKISFENTEHSHNKLCATICPAPCKLTFDLLTLKVVSESRVTRATSVPIFSLPRHLCSRLRPDVRDRETDVRQHHRLMPPPIRSGA